MDIATSNLEEAARLINFNFANGTLATVNGQRVLTFSCSSPAIVWGTGSMSVDVATKNGHSVRQMWIKPGSTVIITTKEA